MSDMLFFTKGDRTVASSRVRAWQIRDRVAPDAEVIYNISYSFFTPSLERFRVIKNIWKKIQRPGIRVLFIQKAVFPWDIVVLFWMARTFLRKHIIFDIDDAEWLHSPYKTRILARMATVVLAGSHIIFDWAAKQGAHVVLVPTVIDVHQYAVHEKNGRILTIGWIGEGRAHFRQGNFVILKSVLSKLAARGIPFRCVIIGSENYEPLKKYFDEVPFEVIFVDTTDWTRPDISSYLMEEYAFDIGVMPLADSEFNRAKCMFKAIEYMGGGVPVVASRIGEATYIVEDKKSGFLCTHENEWVDALEALARDDKLRRKIGEYGRRLVEEKYSLEAAIPLIRKELEALHKVEDDGIVIRL